jgi:carbon monoxide dehydrogenase subunit G
MRFTNEIEVAAPPDELFGFVSDVERVAPCLPGASIEGRDGEDYRGSMRVKVGPITGTYRGKLRFLERDERERRAVMRARAEEVDGQGSAEAKITTAIEEFGDGRSRIRLETDLQMRGRVAQFGRGAMEKISQRMFDEFARNLERSLTGAGDDRPPASEPQAATGPQRTRGAPAPAPAASGPSPGGQSLDAVGLFVRPALDRALPLLLPALVGFGYGYLLGRLRELRR